MKIPSLIKITSEIFIFIKKLPIIGVTKLYHLLYPYFKYRLVRETYGDAIADFRPDVIHANDLTALPAGVWAAERTGAAVIYDAHEYEVHRNPPLSALQKRFVRGVEQTFIRKADKVITVSDEIASSLQSDYGIDLPVVIYNSPVTDKINHIIKIINFDQRPISDEEMNAMVSEYLSPSATIRDVVEERLGRVANLGVYVGLATFNRGLDTVVEALQYLPTLTIAAVGPRNERYVAKVMALCDRLKLSDRFIFVDPVPSENVTAFIASADFGVIPTIPQTLSYEYSMPNKLFEMALAGIPIVASNTISISRFLEKNKIGLTFESENAFDCAKVLAQIVLEKELWKPDEAALVSMRETYGWEAQEAKLYSILQELRPNDRMMAAPLHRAQSR